MIPTLIPHSFSRKRRCTAQGPVLVVGGGRKRGGGGVLHAMHGRSHMATDPEGGVLDIIHGRSCLTMVPASLQTAKPGRSTSGFHRSDKNYLRALFAKRRGYSASRMKGEMLRGGEGGVLDVMHGRGRTTVDPRIPTMPGRRTSSFHQPGRYCLHQARSAVRCWASRIKGELHPTKNRL